MKQAPQAKLSRKGRLSQPQSVISSRQLREYNQIQRNKQIFIDFIKFFLQPWEKLTGYARRESAMRVFLSTEGRD